MSHFVVQVAFLFTLAVPFFQSSDGEWKGLAIREGLGQIREGLIY